MVSIVYPDYPSCISHLLKRTIIHLRYVCVYVFHYSSDDSVVDWRVKGPSGFSTPRLRGGGGGGGGGPSLSLLVFFFSGDEVLEQKEIVVAGGL